MLSLKRQVAPAHTSAASLRLSKVARTTNGDHRSSKKVNLSDYEGIIKNIIEACQKAYRCKIFTVDAFPNLELELDFVIECWEDECSRRNVEVEMDENCRKLVSLCLCSCP